MSMSHTLIGSAILVLVGTFGIRTIAPVPPITIQRIAVEDGMVVQERTITTGQQAFYAQWAATVEDAATGASLIQCEGSGANAYPPGFKAVKFSLEDWTGAPGCTFGSLPPGTYRLRASWRWGAESTSARSEPFEVE